jgi:hypothetical protein
MDAEQLTGFEDYIVRNEFVPEKYARYHRLWAERWLAFAGPDPEQQADSGRRRYLEMLAHDGRTADWQVRQADDAIKLYLWNYLPAVRGAQAAPGVAGPTAAPVGPGQALDAMRDELRLRHYAYRTEQTYLEWAGRSLAWGPCTVSRRAVLGVGPESVRAQEEVRCGAGPPLRNRTPNPEPQNRRRGGRKRRCGGGGDSPRLRALCGHGVWTAGGAAGGQDARAPRRGQRPPLRPLRSFAAMAPGPRPGAAGGQDARAPRGTPDVQPSTLLCCGLAARVLW